MKTSFYNEIRSNTMKSYLLMGLFVFLIALIAYTIGFMYGDLVFVPSIILFIGVVWTVFSFFAGDSLILQMNGAKPATKTEYAHYVNTVEGLAIAAGIPTPKAYIIQDSALNAFATGRDPKHAAVTVTTGLLAKLNRQELEGVVAHEIAHIKNYDIRLMMLAAVCVGIITLLADALFRSFVYSGHGNRKEGGGSAVVIIIAIALSILAPFVAQLIKLAVSRKREFVADAQGALLTRYPPGLANALEKIKNDPDPLVDKANNATAHLFISTPFRKSKSFVANLFSTHPDINERMKRLRAM